MRSSESTNYTTGFVEANLGALVASAPLCMVLVWGYFLLNGWDSLLLGPLTITDLVVIIIAFVVGIIAHEAIHAISWSWMDDIDWKHIHFGFKWSTITPYVHCSVPVSVRNYRWGTVMPGLVLGLLPAVAGMIIANALIFYFGLIFTLAAGGDLLILWLLRNVNSNAVVQDHPELIGCQIIHPEKNK